MAPPRKVRRVEEEGVEAQGVANNGDRAEGADEFNCAFSNFHSFSFTSRTGVPMRISNER